MAVKTSSTERRSLATQISLQTMWGYARHEILFVAWALMEVALFAPVALAFMPWARYWPPGQAALWMALVMLIPFNLIRVMGLLNVSLYRQQAVLAVGLLLLILLSFRLLLYGPRPLLDVAWFTALFLDVANPLNGRGGRILALVLINVIMWWRGIRLVGRDPNVQRAGFRLRLGSLLFAPLVVWVGSLLTWDVMPFVLLFFLASLASVSLIRVEQLEYGKTGRHAPLSARWLASIFLTSLLVVGTAGVFAAIVSGDTAVLIAGWFAPLWLAVYFGGAVFLATFLYLSQPLLFLFQILIDWLAGLLTNLFSSVGEQFPELLQISPQAPMGEILGTPEPLQTIEVTGVSINVRLIAILLMVALVLIVSLVLGRLYRQARLAATDGQRALRTPEGIGEGGDGRSLWQRLGFWRNWRTAASIRRIYRQMCAAAGAAGFPRSQSETPYEYLGTLAQVWPERAAETELITQAYVRIRYGELPETEDELNEIKAAWQRLEGTRPAAAE